MNPNLALGQQFSIPNPNAANGNTGVVQPSQGSAKPKKDKKGGINQMQQNLISSLFGSVAPYLGNFFGSNFNANANPNLFNYDPSAFNGLNGMNAAQANFDPYQYFGQTPSVQAATSNFDPSQYLSQIPTNVGFATSNFNPNQYISNDTKNFIGNIGANASELKAIRDKMEQDKGLATLDPQTLANLQAMKQAQIGELDLSFKENKDQLLQDLYGRGMQNSTVALDQSGRLLYGRDQIQRQIGSDDAQRQIGLQQFITQQLLENYLGQASTVRDQANFSAQQAGLSQANDLASMQSGLQNSMFNAGNQQQSLMMNAQNALQKALAGNETGLQQSLFNAGNQQQANVLNSQMQFDRGNLAANLMQQVALQNAGFQQQANQFNSQQDFDIAALINQGNLQTGLANTGFQNEFALQNQGLNQQTSLANVQAIMQQLGMRNDLLGNMMNSFFGRKQDNKKINLQQQQMEIERQQFEKQLAFQYYQLQQQLQAQKGGLFGKILGGLGGIAGSLIPGVGAFLGPALGALGNSIGGSGGQKYVRGS